MSSSRENQQIQAESSATANVGGSSVSAPAPPSLDVSISRALREICCRPDINSTSDLVRVYNDATDPKELEALYNWLGQYVEWFKRNSATNWRTGLIREYAILITISPKTVDSKHLVKQTLFSLCSYVIKQLFVEEESMVALCFALKNVEPDVFDGDVTNLLKLASYLLDLLDPSSVTLTTETYNSHRYTLFALRRAFLLTQQVAPKQLNPRHEEGVYITFKSRLEKIKENQTHFPIYFEAQYIEQILHRLTVEPADQSVQLFRRLMLAGAGGAYLLHAVRRTLAVDVDVDAIKQGYQSLKEATAASSVNQRRWFEELVSLDVAAMLLCKEPDTPEDFLKCYEELIALQQSMPDADEKKLLRFGIVLQLRFLALEGPTASIRRCGCEELMYLGTRYVRHEGWTDPDVVETLFLTLKDVNRRKEFQEISEGALEVMRSTDDTRIKVNTKCGFY